MDDSNSSDDYEMVAITTKYNFGIFELLHRVTDPESIWRYVYRLHWSQPKSFKDDERRLVI